MLQSSWREQEGGDAGQLRGLAEVAERDLGHRAMPRRAGIARTLGVAATVDAQPATYPPRRFGQLQNLSVPDAFDDPITDAETAAWEGDSPSYADNSHVFADYRSVYG